MDINSTSFSSAIYASMQLPSRAMANMAAAVDLVSSGDIVGAAILVNQAKAEAQAGIAVAKVSNEMMGTILDLLA